MGKGARSPLRFCTHFPHPENIPYKQLQLNEDNVEGLLSKPFMLFKLSLLLCQRQKARSWFSATSFWKLARCRGAKTFLCGKKLYDNPLPTILDSPSPMPPRGVLTTPLWPDQVACWPMLRERKIINK